MTLNSSIGRALPFHRLDRASLDFTPIFHGSKKELQTTTLTSLVK
jgi:hypothetical protein